ncbi:UNVERIFIED_ORG: hypothetical protein FHW05_000814 [Pantoea agglomerans]
MCGDFFVLKGVIHAFNLGKPASCRSLWALLCLLATNLSWEYALCKFFVCIRLARWSRTLFSDPALHMHSSTSTAFVPEPGTEPPL